MMMPGNVPTAVGVPDRTPVEVFNVTDEANFSPIFDGGFFGSTDVFPEQPINVMVSLIHRF